MQGISYIESRGMTPFGNLQSPKYPLIQQTVKQLDRTRLHLDRETKSRFSQIKKNGIAPSYPLFI
jgi:hypothetical protein